MAKKNKIDTKYNLKVYWSFLSKYKPFLLILALSVLIVESIGTGERFLFKYIIDNSTAYGENAITLSVLTTILFWVAVAFIVSVALRTIVKWVSIHYLNRLEAYLAADVKQWFFSHLLRLSHSFHVSHKTGSLISRLNRGSGAIFSLTEFFAFDMLAIIFQFIIVGVSLIYFDYQSAIVVLATVVVFAAYSFYMQRKQIKANAESNSTEDIEKASISDSFTNIDSIKYFGKENFRFASFTKLSNNTRKALVRFWDLYAWSDSVQVLILGLGTFFLIYFPIKSFLAGTITLGTVVFIYTVYGTIIGQVYGLIHGVRIYFRAMTDFNDLFKYGKIQQEVKDAPDAVDADVKEGSIEFKNVSFKYKDKKNIFNNFSLAIKPGEKVALVGHSGSGKTTLIKLLYRFYDVGKGAILIDGKDLRSFKQESLRSSLSIVPQEGVLFDDTIYNNIKFSKPDATRAEVMRAIKFAQLDKLIKSMPKKENTVVGERGIKLSGGEKQRVSIARAILANQRIVVLDEATSALDSQTEHDIQKDLKQLLQGRTAVIIAHRLSTIMHADKIVVLEKGKIVQMGTHNELIRKPGVYKKLWSLQKGGYLQD